MSRMVKLALKAGSSKQGKAPRANVASNWVDARILVMERKGGINRSDIAHCNKTEGYSRIVVFELEKMAPFKL